MKIADEDRIRWMTEENTRRLREREVAFDPVSGIGSVGKRFAVDVPAGRLWLPETMRGEPVVARILEGKEYSAEALDIVRMRHDFPYWAATRARIKPKGGGEEVMLTLNRPQRMLVERLEGMRLASRPLRLILLKARQWGGSTCVQLYMAWLQLVHERGLNSLIIAHQGSASEEIRDMFDRLMRSYPPELLDDDGSPLRKGERILSNVGTSRAAVRVGRRDCKIKVGTAERPDSCRGGDYNLVHLSEVGIWKRTLGKRPEDIVRSACSGVLDRAMTMIVYESTTNGTGNFFHREYEAAKRGESQFCPFFVAWHDIEQYSLSVEDAAAFARRLLEKRRERESLSDRREPGAYLWWLWEHGATFESIAWYERERKKYSDHGQMASEYPSDDVEAFVHSGARVFDRYRVEALRAGCRAPRGRGEVVGAAPWGKDALKDVRFIPDGCGSLLVWDYPVA